MDLSTWTPEQIITLAGIIFGFLSTAVLTVVGWLFVSQKNKAETAAIYQDIAHQAVEKERQQNEKIEFLTKEVEDLREENRRVNNENVKLRTQFSELKVQYDEQANELQSLREEIVVLRNKRK